jgi:hypothetical protein
MARHRAPRHRRLFSRKPQTVPTAPPDTFEQDDDEQLQEELDEYFPNEEPAATAPHTAPVARVVDLAERRPRQTTGAEIVMMTRAATDAAVQAVYPDGSIEQVPCELRVVATLPAIRDGMILNVTGGGRSAAIAVTHSP